MRIFGIEHDGTFKEYSEIPFQKDHEEMILENWIETNPHSLLEDSGLLIIGRQVTTNLGGFIDLLGLDREGNAVVIELKRDRTPRDTLAQALEYASFIEELTSEQLEFIFQRYLNDESTNLAEYHQQYFTLDTDEAVAFNKDQRVVIVGQRVSQEILQTSSFLRKKGIRVTCVEFSFFQSEQGLKLLSHEIVVGRETAHVSRITSNSLPVITQEAFQQSLDSHGEAVFTQILDYAAQHAFPIHWGSKGFSLNVDKHGTHVAVCFGYPPNSVYKQSLYTALVGRGGLLSKLAIPEETIAELWQEAEQSGYFQRAGKELKCVINRAFSAEEIERILAWIKKVVGVVQEAELK
jgi:hypothetical protein